MRRRLYSERRGAVLPVRGAEQITGCSHKQDSNLMVKLLYQRKGD